MKFTNLLKKGLLITLSLFTINLFAAEEVINIEADNEITIGKPFPGNSELFSETGTIKVKEKKSGRKIFLTKKGKKLYQLKANDLIKAADLSDKEGKPLLNIVPVDLDKVVVTEDLIASMKGKVVKVTGTLDKKGKVLTVLNIVNITDGGTSYPDAK